MQRKCKECSASKELDNINFRYIFCKKSKNFYFSWKCRECIRNYNIEYRNNNKEKECKRYRDYYSKNKEQCRNKTKNYKNKNRDKVNEGRRKYFKEKRKNDVCFCLRSSISISIHKALKRKKEFSCLIGLNFTILELKKHLEKQFESWMSWNNWGKYDPKTWDDNDPETWTWQIDHITPLSDLPYDSMDHPNFKKCWDLSNLRPYSAKQNILDGSYRTRHKKQINS